MGFTLKGTIIVDIFPSLNIEKENELNITIICDAEVRQEVLVSWETLNLVSGQDLHLFLFKLDAMLGWCFMIEKYFRVIESHISTDWF
jgi:hypothetical protein